MLTLLLTRHGHTLRSDPESYLGQHVVAQLSDRGRLDAAALARRLADVPIDRVISSPLERANETARIVAGERPVEADARLAEMDYGSWEGLTVEHIERELARDYARYEADPSTFHVGGAESGAQVAQRVGAVLAELVDWAASGQVDRTCLVVGHSSVNRVLLAVCLDVPLIHYRRRFQQDWANLTVLNWPDRDAGPQLLLANDMAHLRGVEGVTWG